ncbi:alpha/beta hydrolase fold protein [Hyphomicrobium denitrificans 1NES1]|uniref:Alpha/beta hydrolase fold protein n=1 Tax=Hyphomicrobium denitrificans 1NES1 TaxID=670307 RepID=N0B909_9HYPH|nr:alpha/beta hydrolase fold protein [Hyphomicrobium denitrificans 1NES1]
MLVSDLVHMLDNLHIERANLPGWSMGGNEVTEFAGLLPGAGWENRLPRRRLRLV